MNTLFSITQGMIAWEHAIYATLFYTNVIARGKLS